MVAGVGEECICEIIDTLMLCIKFSHCGLSHTGSAQIPYNASKPMLTINILHQLDDQ